MGNVMTNVSRFALRKARRFNVESRTARFLDKNVKVVAPKHASTVRHIENIQQAYPDAMDKLVQKDDHLHERLKDVYVTSHDKMEAIPNQSTLDRPLPSLRNVGIRPDYGYVEPISNTSGHISLKRAIEMISKHQNPQGEISVASLALEYNLDVKHVESVISYFKVLQLMKPSDVGQVAQVMPGPFEFGKRLSEINEELKLQRQEMESTKSITSDQKDKM